METQLLLHRRQMEITITETIMVLVSVIMVMEPGQMKMGILIRNDTISLTELSQTKRKSTCKI